MEIPLEQLRTNPLNLRRRVGDIKALTKSIAEVGIVVPLIVTPAEDGTYLLAAGERRLTAARAAGLAVAPCVVKNLTEAEQVEIMLTENDDDRTPLSPSERAAGYLRLVSLGCTVRRLAAKVGRSAKHVSTHMALLELPERAQLAVDAGELSMADVAALVKVKDQPELIEEVLALPAWNRHDIAMVIERRIAQRRQEEAYAEAVAEQEAKGHRVIESTSVSQSKAKRLRDLGFKVADHKAEPCHAVVVERYLRGVEVVEVCDDPRRHTAKAGAASRSELQVTPATVVGQSPEDRERRSERKRVLRRRAEFLAEALARRSVPKPRDATAFCLHAAHGAGQRQRLGSGRGAAGRRAGRQPLGRQGLAPAHPRAGRPLQRRPAARGHGDGGELRRGTHQLLRRLWRRGHPLRRGPDQPRLRARPVRGRRGGRSPRERGRGRSRGGGGRRRRRHHRPRRRHHGRRRSRTRRRAASGLSRHPSQAGVRPARFAHST